jgi:hypothetical protein
MNKVFFLTTIFGLFILNSFSQQGSNYLKVYASAEFTTGLFDEGYNTGWGIYATDFYGMGEKTSLSLSTGIASWNAKNADITAGMWLTRFGLRQFLVKGFYLNADGGIAVGIKDWSGSSQFAYGGGIGYLLRSKRGGGIDISARVNRSFERTWIGLGAGYEFKL